VGHWRIEAAYTVTTGTPVRKAVLLALARRACDTCGFAWPGVAGIAESSELKPTAVRDALGALVQAGWLNIYRYPAGGRGVATEYVVLPSIGELSTAPCGECRKRMKNPPGGGGYSQNPPGGGGFIRQGNDIPTAGGVQNPPRGGAHQSEQPSVSGNLRLPESETRLPETAPATGAPAASDHPTGWEIPATAKDALGSLFGSDPDPEPVQGPPRGKAQG
jgi:hypothetical protein